MRQKYYKRLSNDFDQTSLPPSALAGAGNPVRTAVVMNPYFRSPRPPQRKRGEAGTYKDFDATELFCPKCRRAVPVRKRLLLVLPEGDKYEYLCAVCSSTVGTKINRDQKPATLIV